MSRIANELPEPKWMNGSGSMSKKTYMVVARRGDICLGIKLEGMVPGDKLKMPGKTYLLFRVRSARQPDLFAEEDAQQKVVPLNGNMGLDEAWPNFTFDVVNSSRASAAVGVFIDGSLLEDPAAFCEKFIDGDYVGKSIDYVLSRAGEDNVILPRDVIVETFTEKLDTLFSQVKDWHDQVQAGERGRAGVPEGDRGRRWRGRPASRPAEVDLRQARGHLRRRQGLQGPAIHRTPGLNIRRRRGPGT